MFQLLLIVLALNHNIKAFSKTGDWLLGGYQKGLEIRLNSGVVLKQYQELSLNMPIGYLSRVTTNEMGALLVRSPSEVTDKIWLAPRTEISTLTQELSHIIQLNHGRLRVKANATIRILLGDCQLHQDQDIVMAWKPKESELRIHVLEGQIQMPCFDFDKPITLKKGEAAVFLADQSGGALVFDLLPSGVKMPRGVLNQIKREEISDLEFDWIGLEAAIKKQATPSPPLKKKAVVRTCSHPSADFGVCMIKKTALGRCTLYRCSAQGTWEYGIELAQGYQCTSKGQIADCHLK